MTMAKVKVGIHISKIKKVCSPFLTLLTGYTFAKTGNFSVRCNVFSFGDLCKIGCGHSEVITHSFCYNPIEIHIN
jgi:hypothetical protein